MFIVFSLIIHTENRNFVGNEIRDLPRITRKLVPRENKTIHSISPYVELNISNVHVHVSVWLVFYRLICLLFLVTFKVVHVIKESEHLKAN